MPQIREQIAMVHLPPSKTLKYLFHVRKTKKHRNFDTMGIRVAVLAFCLKALISRDFGLLRYRSLPNSNDSPPPIQFSRELNSRGLSFIFKVVVSFVGYRLGIKSQ